MNTLNSLNLHLNDKRKYLLITLNVVLSIFIILEVMIWNQVNGLLSAEEVQYKMNRFCEDSHSTSCRYGRGTR